MNKELEALEKLRLQCNRALDSFKVVKDIELVRTALTDYETLKQRDTAMKVIQDWVEEDNRVFECPNCKDTWFYSLSGSEFKFCANCGQRLNWGE